MRPPKYVQDLIQRIEDTQEQIALVHGVLEELCERTEALSSWHMEFAKHLLALQVGAHNSTTRHAIASHALEDTEESAEDFEKLNRRLATHRDERQLKQSQILRKRSGIDASGDAGGTEDSNEPESVLVIPPNSRIH